MTTFITSNVFTAADNERLREVEKQRNDDHGVLVTGKPSLRGDNFRVSLTKTTTESLSECEAIF